jgi:hypothetical protein
MVAKTKKPHRQVRRGFHCGSLGIIIVEIAAPVCPPFLLISPGPNVLDHIAERRYGARPKSFVRECCQIALVAQGRLSFVLITHTYPYAKQPRHHQIPVAGLFIWPRGDYRSPWVSPAPERLGG